MTEKDLRLQIFERDVTLQTQSDTIDCLTRTVARLYFELSQLPGGMDIIKKLNAENDDDDDESDSKATVLQLVKNDDDSDDVFDEPVFDGEDD